MRIPGRSLRLSFVAGGARKRLPGEEPVRLPLEYLQFFVALIDAVSADYVIERNPSAAAEMSGLVKANVSFVQKNEAVIDALGPDIKAIQKAGEDD